MSLPPICCCTVPADPPGEPRPPLRMDRVSCAHPVRVIPLIFKAGAVERARALGLLAPSGGALLRQAT